jgi:hypothetical protein
MPIGQVPTTGFQPVDNDWLNGMAGGHNYKFQNGLTAIGNSQATSLQLADRIAMLEVDTSSASTGVAMPPALGGVTIYVANNTANNITVYPSIANNPVTAAQDTFNNAATSFTLNAHTLTGFTCIKPGIWFTN